VSLLQARVAPAAREHGIVILAGAGISMAPPSSLPGWWDFNEAVLQALADRLVEHTSKLWTGQRLASLLERRRTLRAFTPDFMAQVMEEEVSADYFRVLQALDADQWNTSHAAVAALAGSGVLRAVITTNFDRLIERALASAGIAHRVFAGPEDFAGLVAALADTAGPLPVIKVHGTVERPETMVDTLAQRVAGRPQSLEDAIAGLLERHACLAVGFSGADLAYDPDYLGLRRAADRAVGLTVLVRAGTAPLAAMADLLAAYGPRGGVETGELPGVLQDLCTALGATPTPVSTGAAPPAWGELLRERTRAWIDGLGTMPAINMFVSLVDANADDPGLLDFLLFFRRHYRTEADTVDPWEGTRSYWRYEYNFGKRLLERGRLSPDFHELDAGRALLDSRTLAFRPAEDALTFLNNAAQRGHLLEAKCALTELVLYLYGPGRAMAHATQAIKAVIDAKDGRVAAEAALDAARVGELALDYQFGSAWLKAASEQARLAGDEPRRAAAAVGSARMAACVGQHDLADRALAEAAAVGERLALSVLQADVDAARGMMLGLRDRDAEAVAPLTRACDFYRRTERQPRLLVTLLDLVRAAHYSGQPDVARGAYGELKALQPRYPGLAGPVLLVQAELMISGGNLDRAAAVVQALREEAGRDAEFPWKQGFARADRLTAQIAKHRASSQGQAQQ
jgi:SIR2-like domain